MNFATEPLAAGFSPGKSKTIRDLDGEVYVNTIGYIVAFEPIVALRDRIVDDLLNAALLGGGIGALIVIGVLVALRTLGSGLRRGRRLRGGELVGARALARRAMPLYLRPFVRALLHEVEELPGAVALVALTDDEAGGDIECGGGHPVSAVPVLTTGISDHRVV